LSEGRPRRRLRIRRRRKDETFVSKAADYVDDGAVEVVGHVGCCLVEAVGSVAILAALAIPAYLLLSRVA
jgi:hypothetical protein